MRPLSSIPLINGKEDRRRGGGRSFVPGVGGPSRAGKPNKMTKLIKDAIILAAELEGDVSLQTGEVKKMYAEDDAETAKRGGIVGYLRWMARKHPQSFSALLSRVMPMQIRVDAFTRTVYESVEDVRDELAQQGLSLDALAPVILDGRRVGEDEYSAEG